jgi:ABC-2 type transport system ATP-binding protein/lipopolysaccharide transport system ATP-binding protein
MAGAVIQVENVAKRYRLGSHGSAYRTLRETLASRFARDPVDRETWALRDVSFEVETGQAVGVIGANGAGKSTLLKILSRITQPTQGASRTRGRLGSLLEVGTGFHPELTGRENVYLNGAILGLRRREITRRFDEIVEFSGVERFLDTPLKRYSSGMYLRLAFAVAAHVEPEIMLVDEVLAVGDARFREKCLGKMTELGREGRTVLFVSHDLGAITRLCDRAIWLADGRIVSDGAAAQVVEAYLRDALPGGASRTFEPDATRRASLLSAAVHTSDGSAPTRGEELTISVSFRVQERIPSLSVAFILHGPLGVPVLDEDWGADTGGELRPVQVPQDYSARLGVPAMLPSGNYRLDVWVGTSVETLLREEALSFRVAPRPEDVDEAIRRRRAAQPAVRWTVEEVAAIPVSPAVGELSP